MLLKYIHATITPTIDVISLSASWADILLVSPTTSDTNTNVTCTFVVTSPRTLMINYFGVGQIYYRKDSGTYTAISNGGTFTITSGQTVNFKYENTTGTNEANRAVTVTDSTRGGILNVFYVRTSGFSGDGGPTDPLNPGHGREPV